MRSRSVFFLLLICQCGYAQPDVPTCNDHGLKGTVHFVFSIGRDSLLAEYDDTGKALFVKEDFNSCLAKDVGMSHDVWRYRYDSEGRLLGTQNFYAYEVQALEPGDEGLYVCEENYTWSRWGQLERSYRVCVDMMGNPGETTFYSYDKQGNLIQQTWCSSGSSSRSDSLLRKHEFIYNKKNRLIERKTFLYTDDTVLFSGKSVLAYYKNGLLKETTLYDASGGMLNSSFYKYTRSGKPLERTVYTGREKKIYGQWNWVHSDSGSLLVQIEYFGPSRVRTETAFNTYGDKTLLRYYKADGSLDNELVYTYVYDTQGNWITVSRSDRQGSECTTERKIVYWNTQ